MSNDNKGVDSTEENLEEGENLEENTSEDDEESQDEDSKFEDQKKRAEKAEEEAKKWKKIAKASMDEEQEKESEDEELPVDRGGLTRDEAILYAKGLSEEEIQKADKIAQVEGVSLAKAVDTDLFVTWKEKRDEENKAQQASIGASSGSGSQKKGKDLSQSGLNDADHEALAKKRLGL